MEPTFVAKTKDNKKARTAPVPQQVSTRSRQVQDGSTAGTPLFLRRSPNGSVQLQSQPQAHTEENTNLWLKHAADTNRVQTKLAISQSSDPDEQEADRWADQVVSVTLPVAKHQCAGCRADTPCSKCGQAKQQIRRKVEPNSAQLTGFHSDGFHSDKALRNLGEGKPIDSATRAFMESQFEQDFKPVRIHTNPSAAKLARSINALAFTSGQQIVFGENQYQPETIAGKKLLAHELAHVIQQDGADSHPIQRSAEDATQMTVTHEFAASFTDEELMTQIQIVREHLMTLSPASLEYETLNANLQILESEQTGRNSSQMSSPETEVQSSSPESEVQFNVHVLNNEDFLALTGLTVDTLPEGVLVGGGELSSLIPSNPIELSASSTDWIHPGDAINTSTPSGEPIPELSVWTQPVGKSASLTRFPSYPIPPNATGIIWTQLGAGHLSEFANVRGEMTARGFRYAMWRNLFPASRSTGVPGGFRNDLLFTLMPNQTIIYRASEPAAAEAFAQRLLNTEYNQTYRFPPRAGSGVTVCGTNCINVPADVVREALGVSPEILTPEGPVDITRAGRPSLGAPFDPLQAGRGATMREFLAQDDAYFRERGLVRTPVPGMTIAARGGVGFIKVGGGVLMIYGAYRTKKRLEAAYGTEEFPAVVAEEAGAWGGGIWGTAVGSALGGAVACAPGGPVDLLCIAGGFVGGLIIGTIGSIGGAKLARSVVEYFQIAAENPILFFPPAAAPLAMPAHALGARGGYGGLLRSPLDVEREMRRGR